MLKITVDDTELQKALTKAKTKLGNTKPLMAGIANLMLEAVEESFDKETDPNTGQKWKPLSPLTKEQRSKRGHDGKILQVSGALASSISSSYDDSRAVVGTNKVYAPVHQFGAVIRTKRKRALAFGGVTRSSVTIPARPFLGISRQTQDEINDLIEVWAANAIDGEN